MVFMYPNQPLINEMENFKYDTGTVGTRTHSLDSIRYAFIQNPPPTTLWQRLKKWIKGKIDDIKIWWILNRPNK